MSLSQPTRAERAAERAADDRIEPWSWKMEAQSCDIPRGEEIILAADGACRRGERIRCACAVFDGSYDSPYSKAFKTVDGIDDSLKAETCALILLLKTAISIVEANPGIKKVKARIDCAPLYNTVQNGDITQFITTGTSKRSSCQENLFNVLRIRICKLELLGPILELEWVPRTINIEADELCNAILDGRVANDGLRSRQHAPEITVQILFETLVGLANKRRTTIRSLPMELAKVWQTFIYGLLTRYKKLEKLRTRLIFFIAPHLITVGRKSYIGQADFANTRTHLMMLLRPEYLDDVIMKLWTEVTAGPEQRETTTRGNRQELSSAQIRSYCCRGIAHKCWETSDICIADNSPENVKRIQAGIPQADLPMPCQVGPKNDVDIKYADVRQAIKKMKNGKTPGVSGWCRELLYPVACLQTPHTVQEALTSMFRDISNATISEGEQEFLRSLILVPFKYAGRDKIRAILITDTIIKVCWKMLLTPVEDDLIKKSGLVFNKPGQSSLGVCAIQQALCQGRVVVALDATNAFPSLLRSAFMEHMASVPAYFQCIRLVNMIYAHKCTARWYVHDGSVDHIAFDITDGCLQGCVSGPACYAAGTVRTALQFSGEIATIADDNYLIGENALKITADVIAAFKQIHQDLDGPKLKVILPAGKSREDYPELSNPEFANATIITKPVEVLGGVVTPRSDSTYQELREAAGPKVIQRLTARVEKILSLDTTKQIKLLILRRLTNTMMYFAQTTFHQQADTLFKEVDEIITNAFVKIFPDTDPSSHTPTLNKTIEDGGLGFMSLASLQGLIQGNCMNNATEYMLQFGLDHQQMFESLDKSIRYLWRRATVTRPNAFDRDGMSFRRDSFSHWLESRPSNSLTRLSDAEISHQINIILQNVRPFAGQCQDPNAQQSDFLQMTRQEFTHHSLTCKQCVQAMLHARHEKVVVAIRRTNKFHGIATHIPNTQEFPLPGNSRGGPDIMIFGEGTDACDVTVSYVHQPLPGQHYHDELRKRFLAKQHKYAQFRALTQYRIVPYVVSHLGIVGPDTRELVQQWKQLAADPQYLYDLFNNTQMAVVRSQYSMFDYFKNCNDKRMLAALSSSE